MSPEKLRAVTREEWDDLEVLNRGTNGGGGKRYPRKDMVTHILLALLGFALKYMFEEIKDTVKAIQTEVSEQGKSIARLQVTVENLKEK